MTLRKQLFFALSVMFLLLLLAVMSASMRGTRHYVEEQLASHAQDTATALSHSLADALSRGDPVLAAAQVKSFFDRGYFRQIVVMQADGAVFHSSALPDRLEGVPAWFVQLFPLEAAPGEAFVTSGWRQLGKVGVVSQPTHAYEHLWNETTDLAGWLAAAYAAALYLTGVMLRVVLSPLAQIERVAIAIQGRRFETIASLPRAQELARVVQAMNSLSRRVHEMLDIEFKRAEALRREAYSDEVTGLDNRRGFELRLNQALGGEQFVSGCALTVSIEGLREFSVRLGYGRGDALLRAFAEAGQAVFGKAHGAMGGRISGQGFMFVQFDVLVADFERMCGDLKAAFARIVGEREADPDVSFSMGAATFGVGDSRSQVMARTDLACEVARAAGRGQWHLLADEHAGRGDLGSMKWRTLISDALEGNRLYVLAQPVVVLAGGGEIHREVMTRLRDVDNESVAAAVFVPMAVRHRLMAPVDAFALRQVVALAWRFPAQRYSLNVSCQSLEHADYGRLLQQLLQGDEALAGRLSFELSEMLCIEQEARVADLVTRIRALGCRFGIDHFGLDPAGLQFVRRVPPDFVKIDGGLVLELYEHGEVSDWVASMVTSLRALSIDAIALHVESEALRERLLELGVMAGQGALFGPPVEA